MPSSNGTPSSPRSSPTHVLVVDDKVAVREFLRDVLEMGGYRVTAVGGGDEALRSASADRVQVVLTDLRMDGMDGQMLVQRMREADDTTVCIVLTGYGTVESAVELMRAGAFEVLTKPCRATEILATVEKAVEHHEALSANRELRQRLQVQDKLAMIGKLAAGVAHELNNPLDATLRCVRLTKDRVQDDPEAQEYLDMAHAGLLRMADIVQSLLTFSRSAQIEQTPEPLGDVVQEAIQAVAMALGDAAPALQPTIGGDAARLRVPRGLHQVLTNLLRNACDACEGLTPVLVHARREDDQVVVSIQDRGPGIPADVIQRVFEPFFTTKEPGRGTGLGLPISARLVERFGGSLRIECPDEGGTVATVTLPVRTEAIAPSANGSS